MGFAVLLAATGAADAGAAASAAAAAFAGAAAATGPFEGFAACLGGAGAEAETLEVGADDEAAAA